MDCLPCGSPLSRRWHHGGHRGKSPLPRLAAWAALYPLTAIMKWRLRRAGVRCNDYVFGMSDTGELTADLVLRFLSRLPSGVTEIFFHPATRRCPEIDRTMPAYRHDRGVCGSYRSANRGGICRLGPGTDRLQRYLIVGITETGA